MQTIIIVKSPNSYRPGFLTHTKKMYSLEGNLELFKAKTHKFPLKKRRLYLVQNWWKKVRTHLIKVFQPYHDNVNNAFEEYVENLLTPIFHSN